MIPMFKKTEEEAQHEYDKIIQVKQRLEQIRDEHKINPPRYIQPMARTSFMVRKTSQNALRKGFTAAGVQRVDKKIQIQDQEITKEKTNSLDK